MAGIRYLRTIVNGVPVVAPPEIDIMTAEELRAVLLEATKAGHPRLVVDMTRIWFCDSAGLQVLIGAHSRVLAEGSELRLVIRADGVRFPHRDPDRP